MRIIAFIQDRPTICKILNHIQEPSNPPPISPARGPPEPEFIPCADRCLNFGGLRVIQILTIERRAILQQYGRRTIVKRWVAMMAAKI